LTKAGGRPAARYCSCRNRTLVAQVAKAHSEGRLEDGGYLAGAISFYLFNRSRAKWSSKPEAALTLNLGLESLIAEVVKARDERAAKLVIEHSSTEGSAQHGESDGDIKRLPKP
jgi:hypothetical protein